MRLQHTPLCLTVATKSLAQLAMHGSSYHQRVELHWEQAVPHWQAEYLTAQLTSVMFSYEANNASIPQGTKIGNNPAKSTFSIVASAGQVEECPDGTYVPVGQECGDGEGECGTPTYVSGSMSPTGQLAAANGSNRSLSLSVQYRGFLDKAITFKSGSARVWGCNICC